MSGLADTLRVSASKSLAAASDSPSPRWLEAIRWRGSSVNEGGNAGAMGSGKAAAAAKPTRAAGGGITPPDDAGSALRWTQAAKPLPMASADKKARAKPAHRSPVARGHDRGRDHRERGRGGGEAGPPDEHKGGEPGPRPQQAAASGREARRARTSRHPSNKPGGSPEGLDRRAMLGGAVATTRPHGAGSAQTRGIGKRKPTKKPAGGKAPSGHHAGRKAGGGMAIGGSASGGTRPGGASRPARGRRKPRAPSLTTSTAIQTKRDSPTSVIPQPE